MKVTNSDQNDTVSTDFLLPRFTATMKRVECFVFLTRQREELRRRRISFTNFIEVRSGSAALPLSHCVEIVPLAVF